MEKTNLTVNEAMLRLRLGRTKVYQLVASGKLPHFRIGRKILVPVSAIETVERGKRPGEVSVNTTEGRCALAYVPLVLGTQTVPHRSQPTSTMSKARKGQDGRKSGPMPYKATKIERNGAPVHKEIDR